MIMDRDWQVVTMFHDGAVRVRCAHGAWWTADLCAWTRDRVEALRGKAGGYHHDVRRDPQVKMAIACGHGMLPVTECDTCELIKARAELVEARAELAEAETALAKAGAELAKVRSDVVRFRNDWTLVGDSAWRWLNRILDGYPEPHEKKTRAGDVARWYREQAVLDHDI